MKIEMPTPKTPVIIPSYTIGIVLIAVGVYGEK